MTPTFDITFKERSLFSTLQPYLVSLTLTDEPGLKSDTCTLTLLNQQLELPQTGELLKVSLGYEETGVYDMGTFEIGGYTLTHKELQLTAHVTTHRLADFKPDHKDVPRRPAVPVKGRGWSDFLKDMKHPKSRSFENLTLAALVEQIAAEHGMPATVSADLQSLTIPTLHQSSESDLHLLTRLGQKYNLLIKPAGGSLVAMPRNRASAPTLPEVTLTPDSVISWAYKFAKQDDIPCVTAKGYDSDQAEEFHETVGSGSPSELGYALRGLYPTREAAKQAAKAAYEKLIQKIHTFSATVIGHPWIAAEARLVLRGFQAELPSRWKISRATHSLTNTGYTTSLEAMLDDEVRQQFEA